MKWTGRLLVSFSRFLPAAGSHLGPQSDAGIVGRGQSRRTEELDSWPNKATRWTAHLQMLTDEH